MFGYIYIITNSINSKVYVGQTIRTLEDRFREHCRTKCSDGESNMLIKRAIKKYGKENFKIFELEKCDVSKLNERENYYIWVYNSYSNGYNSTKGGQLGTKPLKLTEEQQEDCVELYKLGFSLRCIAKEFNVDKATVKHIIEIYNIPLRTTKTYKFSKEHREQIIEDSTKMSRKEIMKKWKISKSYLSQLLNGKRRI